MDNSIPAPAFDIEAVNDLIIYLDELTRMVSKASEPESIRRYEYTSFDKFRSGIHSGQPVDTIKFYRSEVEAYDTFDIAPNHYESAMDAQKHAWDVLHCLGFEVSNMIKAAYEKGLPELSWEDRQRLGCLYVWNNFILHERFKKFPESG